MDDALAAPDANGGTTKEPKSEIEGMGWFAVVIDPEGREVGLFQSSRAG
jgi:predicted enzyme related to lactoylglutathione lyase